MDITIDAKIDQLVVRAADQVEALVRRKPDAVLGVATGSTPEPLYAELARRRVAGLDFSQLRIVSLDEYVGLAGNDPQSYCYFVHEHIIGPLGINPANCVLPDGAAEDPQHAAEEFDDGITALGGVDLQILGVGGNGHIGFNEPGSLPNSPTRVVALKPSTIQANSRFFDSVDDVPQFAITQGVGTILRSRQAILLAFSEAKAHAVTAMLQGEETPDVPVSALRQHPSLSVFLDTAAAMGLDRQRVLSLGSQFSEPDPVG